MLLSAKDIEFKAVRASGPGGQNVNRRSTKVQARVKISDLSLSADERSRVRQKLANRINDNDELIVESEQERSQKRNKEIALARLNELINSALRIPRKRVPTKPSRASKERRLKEKKEKSEIKKERSKKWKNDH